MDRAGCNIIYVDQRIVDDRKLGSRATDKTANSSNGNSTSLSEVDLSNEDATVCTNITTLFSVFNNVYACSAASTCIEQVSSISEGKHSNFRPTIVLVDTSSDEPADDSLSPAYSSPGSERRASAVSNNMNGESLSGIRLLKWIANEVRCQNISKLVVPVAVITEDRRVENGQSNSGVLSTLGISSILPTSSSATDVPPLNADHMLKYLDAGAVDVMRSPFLAEPVSKLATHAYRVHKEVLKEHESFLSIKRVRKRSWVGVNEEKPYAYLRESMVSNLMDGICKPENIDQSFDNTHISVSQERRDAIADEVGKWSFSAHDYSEDELLLCASFMLQHALSMPELERWRIPADQIEKFLVASRAAYNDFVPYHNFRHVVDVLQAVFYFLVQLGLLNDYPAYHSPHPAKPSAPIAKLLSPFEALTLLITAIGHDVGHPGVNNQFLVVLKAPLAQLYNDQSVLESFHCAAYSQLLRRYWPSAFQDASMRKLMIHSILATDMGLHFDYMKKLGYLQEKLHENGGTDGWDGRLQEEQKTLACSLLIKCADISNVARKYHVAAKWADILTTEFARQATMESDLGIPSSLFAPPIQDNIIELGKSQIGFMNFFALPLFQGVTDVLPPMQFSVDELNTNKALWQQKIDDETKLNERGRDINTNDGYLSPRSGSISSMKDPDAETDEAVAATAPHSDISPQNHPEPSRPTSIGTFGPNGQGRSPDQSRRSSLGSPLSFASPELASRRSSGASPTGLYSPPRLEARRSSNTVPSQLQLGLQLNSLSQAPPTPRNHIRGQSSLDQPLTTPPVSIPDRPLHQSSVSLSKNHKHSFSERYQVVTPGGESSLPVNGTTYPYSPLSGATSVMSSNEKIPTILPKNPYPLNDSSSHIYEHHQSKPVEVINNSTDNIPGVRRRSSRFPIRFWRSKRRAQAATTDTAI